MVSLKEDLLRGSEEHYQERVSALAYVCLTHLPRVHILWIIGPLPLTTEGNLPLFTVACVSV